MDTEKYRPSSPSAPVPSGRSGAARRVAAHSAAMSAVLARNWWAVGLRSLVAVAFAIAVILLLPRPTLGALVLLFAAYLAADGALAIVAGVRAMRRGELWQALMFEGAANLMVGGAVLIWPGDGCCRLRPPDQRVGDRDWSAPACRRAAPCRSHGRWLLVLAGAQRLGARWLRRWVRRPGAHQRRWDGGSSAMRCRLQ
jgi:hypothetical protein